MIRSILDDGPAGILSDAAGRMDQAVLDAVLHSVFCVERTFARSASHGLR